MRFTNMWTDTVSSFMPDKIYVVQTNTKVIDRCLLMTTDPGDLVLDPTCGSGTTAYVAERWGRRWINGRLFASCARLSAPAVDGSEVPLLPARRLHCGTPFGGGACGRDAGRTAYDRRHPYGLRLSADPTHNAEIDRQQP